MNRTQEGQFFDVLFDVLKVEEGKLRRLCRNRKGGSSFDRTIANRCMENVFVYLVYKKLLDEFKNWTILWEEPYPLCNLRWRCDIMMVNKELAHDKEASAIKGPWDCIEFGYYGKGMKKYVNHLKRLEDADVKRFTYGERYIVIFKYYGVDEEEKRSVWDSDEVNNYLKAQKIEWTLKGSPRKRIPVHGSSKSKRHSGKGMFEIAFLKIKDR